MAYLKEILLLVALGYVGIALLLFFVQSKLIYYPDPVLVATPAAIGLPFEQASITTQDGVKLDSWFLPADAARGVLLFFHGNAGNISHRLESLKIFHDLGLSVLIFDYRGYGLSEGKPSEQGTYRDAEAVWRYLTEERGVPPDEIVIFGRSLGASIAAYLAERRTADSRAYCGKTAPASAPAKKDKSAPPYPARR